MQWRLKEAFNLSATSLLSLPSYIIYTETEKLKANFISVTAMKASNSERVHFIIVFIHYWLFLKFRVQVDYWAFWNLILNIWNSSKICWVYIFTMEYLYFSSYIIVFSLTEGNYCIIFFQMGSFSKCLYSVEDWQNWKIYAFCEQVSNTRYRKQLLNTSTIKVQGELNLLAFMNLCFVKKEK